mmetsp:Transcript_25013/g.64556  ORF Transcript_25013/g.64556 Transcript_25013/m.64556 type:complete len:300 (-) Transcript_25013:599-1498(-)
MLLDLLYPCLPIRASLGASLRSEGGEHLLRRGDRLLDILLRVCEAHEARLVLRGCEVDALLEHGAVPAPELLRVASRCVRERLDRALTEEPAEHPPDVAAAHLVPRSAPRLEDAVHELLRKLVELLVRAGLLERLERLDTRSHRERVARERARLVHRARGGNELHDLALAAVRADGQAAADDLAHGGHVGRDAEVLLSTAIRHAEARHHLVEDEDRAVLGRERAEALEEGLVRLDEARVADDGLEDDGGDLAGVRVENGLDRRQVVVLCAQGPLRRAARHARRVGEAERRNARARLHKE